MPGTDTHGEFVAEVPGERFAHAGQAHVLAQQRGDFEIEFVEGYDAIETVFTGEIADGVQDLLRSKVLRHGDEPGDGFARPVCVFELVDGEQDNVDTESREPLSERAGPFRRC